MKILADTHLLLWIADDSGALPVKARRLIENEDTEPCFSAASLWEIAIKSVLGRADFEAEPQEIRRGLLDNGWKEIPVSGAHALAIAGLPPLHKDPFDRLLIAQAQVEGLTLLTADSAVARYPGDIRKV